ncbi:GntR family transcriptional regulator [Micromonospora sp. NPDC005163]
MAEQQDRAAAVGARPPQSKTAYVVERLRQEIAAGVIVPGAALRQAEIAARYGVSPTPVREALRILEAAGTISYAPNRGATVREMAPGAADDLYLLRAELEAFATELGVTRQGPGLVEELREIADTIEGLDPEKDQAEMYRLNRRLHFAIFEAGSDIVANEVEGVWELFPPAVTIWGYPNITKELNADHRKIIEAVEAHDAPLARRLMREHILNAARLRRAYVS